MNKKLREELKDEAIKRINMMGANGIRAILNLNSGTLTKCLVDMDAKTLRELCPNNSEMQMIREFEKEYNVLVYYMIQDQGIWPDGCRFDRYSLLYVDTYKEDYEMVREECIAQFKTIPAYVVNMEVPEYSELTEIGFHNVSGLIMNVS